MPSIKKYCLILAAVIGILASQLSGETRESVPIYHWAYDVIDELTVRGYFRDLTLMNRPFTRNQITESLKRCKVTGDDPVTESLLNMLKEEFYAEPIEKLKIGAYLQQDVILEDDEFEPKGIAVSKIGYSIGGRLTIYNSMRLDQYLPDDPYYTGKQWRGFSGYSEQAYINLRMGPVSLQFGRDWQVWGSGQRAHLLFSDNSQPFDMGRLKLNLGNFTFTAVSAQLNSITVSDTNTVSGAVNSSERQRFFTSHRIDWRVSDKLQLGVSEAVLYGGENRTFELYYLNPFIFYHSEQQNRDIEGNTLVGADFLYFPGKGWEVYAEVLMDDWQFDKKEVTDLEPPEVGWIAGCRKCGPFGLAGAVVNLEYSGVTNRTYNTLQPEQKFMHQNKPIGHLMGSDFDSWSIGMTKWLTPKIRGELSFTFIRKGEGDIYAPFDTSFYSVTDVSMGYSEPFPTGIIERTYMPALEIWCHLDRKWDFYFRGEYSFIDNYENTQGKENDSYKLRIGASLDVEYFLSLGSK